MDTRITVTELNTISKKKTIWCIGCGKRLNELLKVYSEEPFMYKIERLLDSNSRLWGKEKKVGNSLIKICGFDRIAEAKNEENIILVTSDHYREIYEIIEQQIVSKKIICYQYPIIYSKMTYTFLKWFHMLPMKRQILFYAGSEPHENADEITRYLEKNYAGKRYSIIYLTDRTKNTETKEVKYLYKETLKQKSSMIQILRYCNKYARSKFICYENEPLEKFDDRQVMIYLNHGTVPLKKVNDVLKQPETLDYAICPGEGCSKIYEDQYGIPIIKQKYMMPARTNHMLKCNGILHEMTKAGDRQVVLWLPTFRQLAGSDRVDSTSENVLSILTECLKDIDELLEKNHQLLVIKKHPREKNSLFLGEKTKNIKIITDEQIEKEKADLQEALKDADALLTDYSSIAFEYMLLDRPIGYVLVDVDYYYRGFSVENIESYMPGIKIRTAENLKMFFDEIKKGNDYYKEERKALVKKLFGTHAYENGAELFVKFLDELE